MSNRKKWKKEEVLELFELFIENSIPMLSHKAFRSHLDRDENLFANQLVRQANGNIAYRSVDCDTLSLSDEEFWAHIDRTEYSELVEENAAITILKMVEKLQLTN